MLQQNDVDRVMGSTVYGSDGEKIGKAGQVYLDDETGRPEWVTVSTGFFGTNESFIPLADASLTDDGLTVPYDKDRVKDAPNHDPDAGHLSPEQEGDLYRYYGLESGGTAGTDYVGTGYDSGRTDVSDVTDRDRTDDRQGLGDRIGDKLGLGDRDRDRDVDDRGDRTRSEGYDTSGPTTDDAMTRSEERLRVGTEKVQTGRARLRKYVVTENVTQTVPVTREEVRVEREPITDGNVGAATSGPDISEEEHEVILTAERPVVAKETVPVERVRLTKEQVTDQETVSEQVRKEQIEEEGLEGTRDRDR